MNQLRKEEQSQKLEIKVELADQQASSTAQANELLQQEAPQQLPVMAKAQQLQQVVPDTTAQVKEAYAAVHGDARISGKERRRRVRSFERKQTLSDELRQTSDAAEAVRSKVVNGQAANVGPDASLWRMTSAWLDFSDTKEAAAANKQRVENLTHGDNEPFFFECEKIFQQAEAFDLNALTVGTDQELKNNFAQKKDILQKGIELRNILRAAKTRGMPIDPERAARLEARSDAMEQMELAFTSRERIVSSPYYALLKKDDLAAADTTQLSDLAAKYAAVNPTLSEYCMSVAALKSVQFGRSETAQKLYENAQAGRFKQYSDEINAKSVKETAARWSPAAVGYKGPLSKIDMKGALRGAGIDTREPTRASVVTGIFLDRTGKKYTDELTDDDRAELTRIAAEVDSVLLNANNDQNGAGLLVQMIHGLLKTPLSEMPIDTPEHIVKNAPMLHSYLSSIKDIDQLMDSDEHTACAAVVNATLTDEEKRQLAAVSAFRAIYSDAISAVNTGYARPTYRKDIAGIPLNENDNVREDDEEWMRFLIASDYLAVNGKPLSEVAGQKGAFVLPQGIESTFTYYWMCKMGFTDSDPQMYSDFNRSAIDEFYGRKSK